MLIEYCPLKGHPGASSGLPSRRFVDDREEIIQTARNHKRSDPNLRPIELIGGNGHMLRRWNWLRVRQLLQQQSRDAKCKPAQRGTLRTERKIIRSFIVEGRLLKTGCSVAPWKKRMSASNMLWAREVSESSSIWHVISWWVWYAFISLPTWFAFERVQAMASFSVLFAPLGLGRKDIYL